ncbi:hypothetical protein BDZ89DRAFT_1137548 [Hymenopellis radicata]|nr:hypothetical protein BDZ89DRAFT_1137548 [Hymenopellis radicata]
MASRVLPNSPGTFQRPSQGVAAHIENILIDDVLKVIFEHVIFSASATAFTVSRVCRCWQEIVLQVSSLWRNISISEHSINQNVLGPVRDSGCPRTTAKSNAPSSFPRIELMLERSRMQLLDIFILIPPPDQGIYPWDLYHTQMLAALLKPYAVCFHTLSIDSYASWQHHVLLLDVLHDRVLPNLVDLNICRSYDTWQELHADFDDATYAEEACTLPSTRFSFVPGITEQVLCPKLRRISLKGSYQDWDCFFRRNLVSITIANRACHESKPGSGGSSLREFAYLKSGLATCLKLASRGSKTREFASF